MNDDSEERRDDAIASDGEGPSDGSSEVQPGEASGGENQGDEEIAEQAGDRDRDREDDDAWTRRAIGYIWTPGPRGDAAHALVRERIAAYCDREDLSLIACLADAEDVEREPRRPAPQLWSATQGLIEKRIGVLVVGFAGGHVEPFTVDPHNLSPVIAAHPNLALALMHIDGEITRALGRKVDQLFESGAHGKALKKAQSWFTDTMLMCIPTAIAVVWGGGADRPADGLFFAVMFGILVVFGLLVWRVFPRIRDRVAGTEDERARALARDYWITVAALASYAGLVVALLR